MYTSMYNSTINTPEFYTIYQQFKHFPVYICMLQVLVLVPILVPIPVPILVPILLHQSNTASILFMNFICYSSNATA